MTGGCRSQKATPAPDSLSQALPPAQDLNQRAKTHAAAWGMGLGVPCPVPEAGRCMCVYSTHDAAMAEHPGQAVAVTAAPGLHELSCGDPGLLSCWLGG